MPCPRPRRHHLALVGAFTGCLWLSWACGAAADGLDRLVPRPRQVTLVPGAVRLADPWTLSVRTHSPSDSFAALQLIEEAARRGWTWRMAEAPPTSGRILWEELPGGAREDYRLVLEPGRIRIGSATASGRFHAVQTLRQIVRTADTTTIRACIVDDAPALATRGVSLDISRGQIPSTEALKDVIRTLSYYKLNALFLYIENSFVFPSAPGAHAADALAHRDVRALQRVADSCGVALIPIVQTLSHHERVLALPKYNRFAENPARGGSTPWPPISSTAAFLSRLLGYWGGGRIGPPTAPASSTLCPTDPAAVAFAYGLVADISRAFPSKLIHVGGDEATEVGTGRSAEQVRRRGRSAVIGDYYRSIRDRVARDGRRMMLYSDMIDVTSTAPEWPRNVDLVVWNYAPDADFARVDSLKRLGFDSLLLNAGIWDWKAFFPDAGRGFGSIAATTSAARRVGAAGVVVSSWGDGGAESLLENSWASFAFAAASAWEASPVEAREFLSRFSRAHHGSRAGALAEVERLVGWQGIDGLAWNSRAFHREPLVRPRGAVWLERMRRLDRDMRVAQRLLDQNSRHVAAHPEHVDALRHAVRRYAYLADREISLHELAVRLESNTAPVRASGGAGPSLEASLQRLVREHEALTADYRRLWERGCRPSGLASNLQRLDAQRIALRRLLVRLRAGELRPWRPGSGSPRVPADRDAG